MSANIWTPQAPAIITPWKWLANFATAGKGVVTDTGKRGVGSNGKAKAFDSGGACADCCGGCPALTVTVTSVDASDCAACVENKYELLTAMAVDGVYSDVTAITFESDLQCYKESATSLFSASIKKHNSNGCVGGEDGSSPQTAEFKITLQISSTDGGATWNLAFVAIFDVNSVYSQFFRVFSWSGTAQALPATVSNQAVCTSGGFFIGLANGGTMTVELA